MILLDDRVGSVDLAKYIPAAEVTRLDCADAVVVGAELTIGVELKRLGDLLRVIQDGRFVAQQLPCLLSSYDRVYLLVEGVFKPGPDGEFLMRRGREWHQPDWGRRNGWRYAEVQRWLFSVEEGAGIRLGFTGGPSGTAAWLKEMDAEFSKPAAERKALKAVYHAPLGGFSTPSLARQFAALLPGVGVGRSAAVATHFKSVKAIVAASAKDLTAVPGVGKISAQAIVKAIEEEAK